MLICLFLIPLTSFARNPQGEFSALVENNKKRSDFKNHKEMMQYVKQHEQKIIKKPKRKK